MDPRAQDRAKAIAHSTLPEKIIPKRTKSKWFPSPIYVPDHKLTYYLPQSLPSETTQRQRKHVFATDPDRLKRAYDIVRGQLKDPKGRFSHFSEEKRKNVARNIERNYRISQTDELFDSKRKIPYKMPVKAPSL